MGLLSRDGNADVTTVLGYLQKDFAGVIKALGEGKLQPVKMITSKIKIDRVVEDGYNASVFPLFPSSSVAALDRMDAYCGQAHQRERQARQDPDRCRGVMSI